MGKALIHPTGTTIYNKDRTYSGLTLFCGHWYGVFLINMDGSVVRFWKDMRGSAIQLLDDGSIVGELPNESNRKKSNLSIMNNIANVDYNGNVLWCVDSVSGKDVVFSHRPQVIKDSNKYYKILSIVMKETHNSKVSKHKLIDNVITELDILGNVLWEWSFVDNVYKLPLTNNQRKLIYNHPGISKLGDIFHINSIAYVGNNIYSSKYKEFDKDNVIVSSRNLNNVFIINKASGDVVWSLYPDFKNYDNNSPIIGQHHADVIPKGFPGSGNILLLDNGRNSYPEINSLVYKNNAIENQIDVYQRDYSRILEINPITLSTVWDFSASTFGCIKERYSEFYSPAEGSVQRLPNGNTLVVESAFGRILEITNTKEVVWEYIYPRNWYSPMVYTAYRYPYSYIPEHVDIPNAIDPINIETFRVPGASDGCVTNPIEIKGL